jgi:2-oxoglutarate ferredoxin oxidoreductase subunit alpha
LALGLVTAGRLAGKPIFYGSYPITPASDILHDLSTYKNFDVRTFQAEDEIAAVTASIGASYAGAIGVTGSSGPGIALKQEAIGLAVMTELPLIIIDVQRGGPSTGLPTKTEQADLLQTLCGRNSESPVPILAAQSPADCFDAAIEAVRIATRYMTPIFLLSDGYLANGAEPWRIPKASDLAPIEIAHATDPATFQPYSRDANGVRPWALPGTPGLQHRIGGLEKQHITGAVNYEPENHQLMVDLRAQKVANIVREIPPQEVFGDPDGELLVVTWGGTYGTSRTAVEEVRETGARVSHMHLRWLNPMPANVSDILKRFKRVLVCELNLGQLWLLLRGKFAIDALKLTKVQGRPFFVSEITRAIHSALEGKQP